MFNSNKTETAQLRNLQRRHCRKIPKQPVRKIKMLRRSAFSFLR